jgi:asparagine synthase (glutamine-hydrolysing)
MCGIAGVVALRGTPPPGIIERMTAALSHRGPDDHGTWSDAAACHLGHRRLSIIDLSANARQPLTNERGNVWLTYNGETYNHATLRARLEPRHTFASETDSEVLVHLYEEESANPSALLNALDGMFAFGLWDDEQRRLLLARDRLGIKPLFWTQTEDYLIFASEVKAILASGLVETAPSLDGIASYLRFRHPVAPLTMFEGIHALEAGHYLDWHDGEVRVKRYWDVEIPPALEDRGERYYRERVRELLTSAVEKRLMSDVPLGAYLSGGLDSSIVVALMSDMLDEPVKTYSIGFTDEADGGELPYAREVAERHGTDHHELRMEREDYLARLPELIRFRDAPLAVPNEVPLFELSRELKRDITVVLSGEGADEIFAGYGDYVHIAGDYAKSRRLARWPGPLARAFEGGLAAKYGPGHAPTTLGEHFFAGYGWFSRDEVARLVPAAAEASAGEHHIADALDRHADRGDYDRVQYALERVHLQNLLNRADAMTMASGVEARVPFVDHELVEFMFTVPMRHKSRWRSPLHRLRAAFSYSDAFRDRDEVSKYVLRRAFASDVPRSVLERPKVGFKVPLEDWFAQGHLREVAQDLLLGEEAASRGLLDVDAASSWLAAGATDGSEFGHRVWMLINLELWLREYFPDGRHVAFEGAAKAGQASAAASR